MGIPFYFASLIRNHSGITRVVRDPIDVDVLGIDFNCLIHQCHHSIYTFPTSFNTFFGLHKNIS
jgi:5'-3' exonuclease